MDKFHNNSLKIEKSKINGLNYYLDWHFSMRQFSKEGNLDLLDLISNINLMTVICTLQ